ncbi:MAG: hypothetical protein AB2A00_26650 [Myxococcota bacterium]
MRGSRVMFLVAAALLVWACEDNTPTYSLRIRLDGKDGGGLMSAEGEGVEVSDTDETSGVFPRAKSSLKNFPCDVSIRLGQCVAARPIQLVFVPASQSQSGTTNCRRSAEELMKDALGQEIVLGRGDAGTVWLQAFHGDDDDDSQLVERREMNAYAELKSGTVVLETFDADLMKARIDAHDADGGSFVVGELVAVPNDNGSNPGVGPRCTWPIGAKAD